MQENQQTPVSFETSETEIDQQPAVQKAVSKKKIFFLFTVCLLAILVLAGVGFAALRKQPTVTTISKPQTNEPAFSPTLIIPTSEDSQNRIAYNSGSITESNANNEVWLMNPDGSNKQKLGINTRGPVYKHPHSNTVFFISDADSETSNFLMTKNIETGELKKFQPAKEVPADVYSLLSIHEPNQISPDSKYVLVDVHYYKICDETLVDQTAPEGNHGCSTFDPTGYEQGLHLYNLETGESTYITEVATVSRWNMVTNEVFLNYFANAGSFNGFASLDLASKNTYFIKQAKTFAFYAYPLFQTNKTFEVAGDVGDGNSTLSFSSLTLLDKSTNTETTIAEGMWADIQPFFDISPSEKYAVFIKQNYNGEGRGISSLSLYNIETGVNTEIAGGTEKDSYNLRGYWLDDEHYITTVNTFEEAGQTIDNYLVKINVVTGEKQILSNENVLY